MQFFSKYLPIEGEIKEGDWFRRKDGELVGKWNLIPDYDLTNYTKVVMFFCSKNIIKGEILRVFKPDMSYWIDCELLEIVTDGETEAFKLNSPKFGEFASLSKNCFKIIGEVSPAAIWIKENDTFKEDEIRIKLINQGYKIQPEQLKYVPENEQHKWTPLVEIKNPSCGCFH